MEGVKKSLVPLKVGPSVRRGCGTTFGRTRSTTLLDCARNIALGSVHCKHRAYGI